MTVTDEILAARGGRCGLSSLRSPSVPELAREFGLLDEESYYKEIDEPAARRLLRTILHRDLAYRSELMQLARAEELADRFLAQFGPGTRYFTNGNWHLSETKLPDGSYSGAEWDAVTQATFDTGVLAIGPERSGCLWVEDED